MDKAAGDIVSEAALFLQGSLVDAELGSLLTCRPMKGEIIWSHIARILLINGISSRKTFRVLTKRISSRMMLLHLSSAAGLQLHEYVERHSILGPCPPGLEESAWGSPSIATVEIGLNVKGFSRSCVRRCHECAATDVNEFGFTWFRRSHQIAGLDWCPVHGGALGQARAELNHLLQFGFSISGAFEPVCSIASRLENTPTFVQGYVGARMWLEKMARTIDWNELQCLMSTKFPPVLGSSFKKRADFLKVSVQSRAPKVWLESHFGGERERALIELSYVLLEPTSLNALALSMAVLFTGPELATLCAQEQEDQQFKL